MERKERRIPLMRQDFFFDQPNISEVQAAIFSKTASIVDIAAKVIKMKKSEPQNMPSGMFMKTFGSVMKMSDGPASGSSKPVQATRGCAK